MRYRGEALVKGRDDHRGVHSHCCSEPPNPLPAPLPVGAAAVAEAEAEAGGSVHKDHTARHLRKNWLSPRDVDSDGRRSRSPAPPVELCGLWAAAELEHG